MKKRSAVALAFTVLGVLLVVAVIVLPVMGASGEPLTIKSMKISVWPEYDDPRVLVMYQGEFSEGSLFPQPVEFPVPLGSEINQVCALQPPDNGHLCQLYETLTGPEGLTVSYTLPIPTYYLEYYWDGIRDQPEKSFNFTYVSPYAIDTLELEVQQPLKAIDFKLAQPFASATSNSLGLKHFHYVFNDIAPGQVIAVDASYIKPDNKLSVASIQSNGEVGSSTGSAAGSSAYGIMGIGGALLVVAVLVFVALRRRTAAAPARAATAAQFRRSARVEARGTNAKLVNRKEAPQPSMPGQAGTASAANNGQTTGAVFCSHCGTKLAAGARFCHACGARVRHAS